MPILSIKIFNGDVKIMKNILIMLFLLILYITYAMVDTSDAIAFEGAETVSSHGYDGCIRIFNDRVSVILEPNCGGRIIEYSLDGVNVLFVDPDQNGWTYTLSKCRNYSRAAGPIMPSIQLRTWRNFANRCRLKKRPFGIRGPKRCRAGLRRRRPVSKASRGESASNVPSKR